MTDFKPGDKVRCIQGYGKLIAGQTYTVRAFESPKYIHLEETPNMGGWVVQRFVLVDVTNLRVLHYLKQHLDTTLSRAVHDELTKLIADMESKS